MLFQFFPFNGTFFFTEANTIRNDSFDIVPFNIRISIFLSDYLFNGSPGSKHLIFVFI